MALGRWAVRSPPSSKTIRSASTRFQTIFNSDAANNLDATIELRLGEHRFRAAIADGAMRLVRGAAASADAIIETGPQHSARSCTADENSPSQFALGSQDRGRQSGW
jgi:hypothetical protein